MSLGRVLNSPRVDFCIDIRSEDPCQSLEGLICAKKRYCRTPYSFLAASCSERAPSVAMGSKRRRVDLDQEFANPTRSSNGHGHPNLPPTWTDRRAHWISDTRQPWKRILALYRACTRWRDFRHNSLRQRLRSCSIGSAIPFGPIRKSRSSCHSPRVIISAPWPTRVSALDRSRRR